MSVCYPSSPSDLESQFGSPHGYHNLGSGHSRGDYVDRSIPTTDSFSPVIDFQPGGFPMNYNFSEGSYSDPENIDMIPFEFTDDNSASPMSNDTFEHDHFQVWNNNNNNNSISEAAQAMTIPARMPTSEAFAAYNLQQQFATQPLFDMQRSTRSGLGSGILPNSNDVWYPESHPEIKIDSSNMSDHGPYSAASLSPQGSFPGPWSAVEASRFSGNSTAQNMSFCLHGAGQQHELYAISNAGSVLSIDSSPQAPGIRTPSSTRSPSFANAQLVESCSHDHVHDHHQETPRAQQNAFQPSRQSLSVDIREIGSQPHDTKHRHRRSQGYREPSHSPISDYVMVDGASSSPSYSGSMKAEPSTSAPRSPMTFIPEQYPPSAESTKQQSSQLVMRTTKEGKRAGGRSVGMHLPAEKAARAKLLREEGSCWICCLQRDSCTPGLVCDRCIKRNQRATMENGLGCDRTKLTDLKSFFLPDFLVRMGDKQVLSAFVTQHISRWRSGVVKVKLNMIWGLPPMEFDLYEFEPRTDELLRQMQYVLDDSNGIRSWIQKRSPPLAMAHIDSEDRDKYENYLNKIVDRHLDKFVDRCYKYEKEDFQGRLFKLMSQLEPETKEQTALIRDIMRLQVVTYIYARSATIPPRQINQLYSLHHSAKFPNIRYGKATSPRMANRQLKVLYCSLFSQIMDSVLRRLQQVLRSSRGGAKWTSAFVALLGLAMCFEEVQRTAHANQDADALMGNTDEREATQTAEAACRCIDEKFGFMANLFRWKYHRGFNPLKDCDDPKVRETLSESSLQFVRGVAALVHEKNDFLFAQQHIPILKANQDKYTGRLVARFLLAFWGPTPT